VTERNSFVVAVDIANMPIRVHLAFIARRSGLSFPPNQKKLPADFGKVTLWKISTPLWVESRNLNLSEFSEKKGYRRDTKKTSGESPRL
jgi:hypothetical protein